MKKLSVVSSILLVIGASSCNQVSIQQLQQENEKLKSELSETIQHVKIATTEAERQREDRMKLMEELDALKQQLENCK